MIPQDILDLVDSRARGQIRGLARIVIDDIGALVLDKTGATLDETGTDAADVTLTAAAAVFRAILDGSQNPITAVMRGKLKVDGNPKRALKVSEILTG